MLCNFCCFCCSCKNSKDFLSSPYAKISGRRDPKFFFSFFSLSAFLLCTCEWGEVGKKRKSRSKECGYCVNINIRNPNVVFSERGRVSVSPYRVIQQHLHFKIKADGAVLNSCWTILEYLLLEDFFLREGMLERILVLSVCKTMNNTICT